MFAWAIKAFTGSFFKGIFGGATKLVNSIWGNATQKHTEETQKYTKHVDYETSKALAQIDLAKTEFLTAGNSTFDRIINGYCRLPRPMMITWILVIMSVAFYDPSFYVAGVSALLATPPWIQTIFVGAWAYYFTFARELSKSRDTKKHLATMKAITEVAKHKTVDKTVNTSQNFAENGSRRRTRRKVKGGR